MNIALVDDDKKQLDILYKVITEELSLIPNTAIRMYPSAEAFLAEWKAGSFDFIVLDIFMGGMSGIDLAREIRETDEDVKLAFCTSSNEFACESYEVNAQYYLHKPITEKNILTMLRRLNIDRIEEARKISLPDGKTLTAKDIIYTEYSNHVISIWLKKQNNAYRIRMSQAEMEALLMPFGYFCSPSKGITVNFYEVTGITDVSVSVTSGDVLPLSRRKAREIKDAFAKFHIANMNK